MSTSSILLDLPPVLGSTAGTTHPSIIPLLILTIAVLPLTPARRLEVIKAPISRPSVTTSFLLQEVKIFGEDELQLQYAIANGKDMISIDDELRGDEKRDRR